MTDYFQIFTTIIISLITSYLAFQIQIRLEGKRTLKRKMFEYFNETLILISNLKPSSLEMMNAIENYHLPSKKDYSDLLCQLKEYNELIGIQMHYLKAMVIDMFMRMDESDKYLEHHFDDETNCILNKVSFYLLHDNWHEWLDSDFNTCNYLKRKASNASDCFECFWQVKIQAVRNLIFRAPLSHYWDFMVE